MALKRSIKFGQTVQIGETTVRVTKGPGRKAVLTLTGPRHVRYTFPKKRLTRLPPGL